MILTKQKLDRYPGIKAFEKNQHKLFKGREHETAQLFNLVLAENLVVVFSKSGVGKSSLLNAGLNPVLESRGFIPVNIRVQPTEGARHKSPASIVKVNLQNFAGKVIIQSSPEMDLEEAPIWEYIKSCSFPMDFTLVLVLDQFEEFFSNESDYQNEFLHGIKEILHSEPPIRILEWYKNIPIEDRTSEQVEWCSQPQVKVVIGIREDRFGELNELARVIPDILRNRFKLNPLPLEGARQAIELPAKMSSSKYNTPIFSYTNEAIEIILNQLSGGKNYVESSQLQIVCNQIENKVKNEIILKKNRNAIVIDPGFFGGKAGIDDMIKNFYYKQIGQLPDSVSINISKDLLELKLVHNGKRVLMSEDQVKSFLIKSLKQDLNYNKNDNLSSDQKNTLTSDYANKIISRLLELRLIRGDYREEVKLYELSHDTLLQPINKEVYLRSKKEELDKHINSINEGKIREKLLEEEKQKARAEKALKEEAIRLRDKAELAEKKTNSLLRKVQEECARANYHKKKAYTLSLILSFVLLISIVAFVAYINYKLGKRN